MNVEKDFNSYFQGEPPGLRTNAVRWLQKQVMRAASELPWDFATRAEWEVFRAHLRQALPQTMGVPVFPPMQESLVRGRARLGERCLVERVDVFVDEDYAIPTFVVLPAEPPAARMPALVWNPGWPQTKWDPAYQQFAIRMAEKGMIVLIPDHAPFGETGLISEAVPLQMTLVMGMGNVLGFSQLAVRAAETMRCGEYLRARPDVDPARVAVAGLCQGGMDTWLSGALDERFCAVAPFCSASTFAIHFAEMANYQANADSSPFPFGVLRVCDVEHLHAAVAPRPLLVRANLSDNWWPLSGYDSIEAFTRKIYRLYDAEDQVDFRFEAHEHNLTGPFADALDAFLVRMVISPNT